MPLASTLSPGVEALRAHDVVCQLARGLRAAGECFLTEGHGLTTLEQPMGVHIARHALRIAAGFEYPDRRRDVRQVGAGLSQHWRFESERDAPTAYSRGEGSASCHRRRER